MALSARQLAIGLTLIVIGLIADIAAGYALPAPAACNTATCNAAEVVGLIALLLLIVGVAIQVRVLTSDRAATSLPPGFQPGMTPPAGFQPGGTTPPAPAWGYPMASAPPPPAPSPSAAPPPSGATAPPASVLASSPAIRCGRCGRIYSVGQFSYCPNCGSPLPFAPG